MFRLRRQFLGSARRRTLFAALAAACAWCPAVLAQADGGLEAAFRSRSEATLGTIVRDGRSSFAGAVLVEDGALAAASTYGVEDPTSATPVSVDSTRIDLNSLRKLFIAVAVAQLIDRGVIGGIDDPVNRYLKHYRLPDAFGREVSIRALATHTAGLDQAEFGAGLLARDPARYFAERFPGYVDDAGGLSAYDSYGPRLLAYMVSELTERPFSRYVEESILGPLGMNDTHLRATAGPLPHRVVAFQPRRPAVLRPGDELMPVDETLVDGSSVSTFSDVVKFMRALVGPAPEQTVVTPRMRGLMFQILQSNGDGGSAHGLLFDAIRVGATTLFVHGGVGLGTKCMMALEVPRQIGLFYCYGDVRRRFDRDPGLFPPSYERMTDLMLEPLTACEPGRAGGCPPPVRAAWNDSWMRYTGLYVSTARHHRGFSRLRSLIYPTLARVKRAGGFLELDGVGGYAESAPGIFASPHHLATFSFIRDGAGNIRGMSISDRPSAYDRAASVLDDPRAPAFTLAALVLIALSGGIYAVIPAFPIDVRGRVSTSAYALIVGCAVAVLFGFGGFGRRYFEGIRWPLDLLRACAFLTIPASAALLAGVPRMVRNGRPGAGRPAAWHYVLIAVSSMLMALLLASIGVLGFSPIA